MGPKSLFHTSPRGLNHNTMKYGTKADNLSQYRHLAFVILVLVSAFAIGCDAATLKSKSILCADAKCEALYGKGQTITKYPSPNKDVLSFKKDVPVKIFGKTEDSQFLFVEINNSRGFVPTQHVQESAVYIPQLDFKVDLNEAGHNNQQQSNASLEPSSSSDSSPPPSADETPVLSAAPASPINEQPSASFVYTSKSATVIEGTTFYEEILKPSTPSPTYPADAVSKTATIEANFAPNELDKQSVVAAVDSAEEGVEVEDGDSSHETIVTDAVDPLVNDSSSAKEKEELNPESDNESAGSVPEPAENEIKVEEAPAAEPESQLDQNDSSALKSESTIAVDDSVAPKEDIPSENEIVNNNNASVEEEKGSYSPLESKVQSPDDSESSSNNVESQVGDQSKEGGNNLIDDKPVEASAADHEKATFDQRPPDSAPLDQLSNESPSVAVNQSEPELQQNEPTLIQLQSAAEPSLESSVNDSFSSDESQQIDTNTANNDSQTQVVDNPLPVASESANIFNEEEIQPLTEIQESNEQNDGDSVQAASGLVEAKMLPDTSVDPFAPTLPEELNLPPEPAAETPVENSNPVSLPVNDRPEVNSNVVADNLPQQPVSNAVPPVVESGNIPSRFPARRLFRNAHLGAAGGGQPPPPPLPNEDNNHPNAHNNPQHVHHPPPPPPLPVHEYNQPLADSASFINPSQMPNNIPPPQQQAFASQPSPPSPPASFNPPPIADSNIIPPPPVIPPVQGDNLNNWNSQPSSQEFVAPVAAVESENPNQSYSPASDALIDPEKYSGAENSSGNASRRKLLAEKVAFVGVIMNIIPDEVELFFENFNISIHVVVFTSIIAFFWCFTKVVVSFLNSSKKERELRDRNCQVQRKIYFFQAEREKLTEERKAAQDKLSNHERDLNNVEKRKHKLDSEHEHQKSELQKYKLENESLRMKLSEDGMKLSQLGDTLGDFEKEKLKNCDLEEKIAELEDSAKLQKEKLKKAEEKLSANEHEIKSLNETIKKLTQERDELEENLSSAEQNFTNVQSDNQSLKAKLNDLNEQMKNMKDEVLSWTETSKEKEKESTSRLSLLEKSNQKVAELTQELEARTTELISTQTLCTELNKRLSHLSKDNYRRKSHDLNGDITDASMNGDSGFGQSLSPTNNQSLNNNKIDEESDSDMQDIVQLQLRLTNIELEKRQVEQQRELVLKELQASKELLENIKLTNESLKEETDAACKERTKAVTELEVLSKYYKEKELEYGREIGVQRVKREQKEEDADSMSQNLQVTKEENDNLRVQLKQVKKELEETERRYKGQLNQLEKQSHENWIAARNAERKYEESTTEASVLRQRLTMAVKSPPPGDLSLSGFLDDTASSISSMHDGFNTSIPPPPPPPLPLMMMMGGMGSIAPPPPPPTGAYGDDSERWNWNAAAAAAAVSAANTSLTNQAMPPAPPSLDSSLVFVQSGQMPSYAQPSLQAAQLQSPQSSNAMYQQYSAGQQQPPQQPQHNPYNQWGEDLSRNTYSPALSQRSARSTNATPLTNLPMVSSSAVTSPAQAYQQYPQQHYGSSVQLTSVESTGASVAPSNPYSISNYHQTGAYNNQQQQQQAAYQQQAVDPNSYGTGATQSQQVWPGQQQQHQIHPDPNAYAAYAQHANAAYGTPQQVAPNESNNSRPASVHTQMV